MVERSETPGAAPAVSTPVDENTQEVSGRPKRKKLRPRKTIESFLNKHYFKPTSTKLVNKDAIIARLDRLPKPLPSMGETHFDTTNIPIHKLRA
jgi:hypothetical protein